MEARDETLKYNGVQPLVSGALSSRHAEFLDAFDKAWNVGHSWLFFLPRPSGETVNTSFLFLGLRS